jgi:hypothetical protein
MVRSMVWPGPRDDPAPDVIGDGDTDHGLLVRWPWLKRSWLKGPGIITGALLAAAAVAAAAVAASGSHTAPSAHGASRPVHQEQPSVTISSKMAGSVQADGTFAGGSVAGRSWRMAVQNIAGAGGRCQPAVTVNGMDADPLYPGVARATLVGDPAFMAPGAAAPGAGFAFIRVPADTTWVWLDPAPIGGLMLGMQPVTVTSCGERFRLVGFAYPLAGTLRIHDSFPAASGSYAVPAVLSDPQPSLADPQVDGVWQDTDSAHARVTTTTLAAGQAFGQRWSIRVAFGTAGDCFTLSTAYIDDSVNAQPELAALCGPVSTPQGPDTIMGLGLGSPPAYDGLGVGYAVSVGPGIVRLTAHLSDGRVMSVTPVTVAGRKYAAFFVPGPAHLTRLSWDGAADKEIADVQGLQDYGYIQFHP